MSEIDAHWHEVTALRLWLRKWKGKDGLIRVEPWVVSASLDGTIRKWKLSGIYALSLPKSLMGSDRVVHPSLRTPSPTTTT
jgi:hypothetical protein